jgi:hypothetical protein
MSCVLIRGERGRGRGKGGGREEKAERGAADDDDCFL